MYVCLFDSVLRLFLVRLIVCFIYLRSCLVTSPDDLVFVNKFPCALHWSNWSRPANALQLMLVQVRPVSCSSVSISFGHISYLISLLPGQSRASGSYVINFVVLLLVLNCMFVLSFSVVLFSIVSIA